jgi:FkbM family methyltransferase
MAKIFLDIGAFTGDTLVEALKYDYDRIECFEPSSKHYDNLVHTANKNGNVRIHRFGLYDDFYQGLTLYGSGSDGASVFKEKPFMGKHPREICSFVNAGQWFTENIPPGHEVHCKINVEGAEVEILESLFKSSEILKINEILVHYDCEKLPLRRGMSKTIERMFYKNEVLPNRVCVAPPNAHVIYGEPDMGGPGVNARWLKQINKLS